MGDRLGAEGEEATRLERELRDTQARLQLLQTYVVKDHLPEVHNQEA